jgi:hypothetical protein
VKSLLLQRQRSKFKASPYKKLARSYFKRKGGHGGVIPSTKEV